MGLRILLVVCAVAVATAEAEVEADATAKNLKKQLAGYGADSMAKRAAVGGAIGFACGFVTKKMQDFVLNTVLFGGITVAGACYMGWLKPEDVTEKLNDVADQGAGYVQMAAGMIFGEDAENPADKIFRAGIHLKGLNKKEKSKIVVSKLTKKLPGFVGGLALGTLLGYQVS